MFTNTPLYNPKNERDTFLNITSNEQEYEIIIIVIVLHKKWKDANIYWVVRLFSIFFISVLRSWNAGHQIKRGDRDNFLFLSIKTYVMTCYYKGFYWEKNNFLKLPLPHPVFLEALIMYLQKP